MCRKCKRREIARRYIAAHPERNRASSRKYAHKKRYGSYVKKLYCELCRKTNVELPGKRKTLIHHERWADCLDCQRTIKGQTAKCKKHLVTICYKCHFSNHIRFVRTESRDSFGKFTKNFFLLSSREDAYLAARMED